MQRPAYEGGQRPDCVPEDGSAHNYGRENLESCRISAVCPYSPVITSSISEDGKLQVSRGSSELLFFIEMTPEGRESTVGSSTYPCNSIAWRGLSVRCGILFHAALSRFPGIEK